ncbi:MAG TPA: hypothetical protein VFN10_05400 [Thermoanaerobaculia bacterium]|nr:hypothetical protein [Thermoanaerobaculia bacterium]
MSLRPAVALALVVALVMAVRVSAAEHAPGAERLVTNPQLVPSAANVGSVASNGRGYALLSQNHGAVYGSRLISLDPTPEAPPVRLPVSTDARVVTIADQYFVVWTEASALYAASFDDVAGTRRLVATTFGPSQILAVAGNDDAALILIRDGGILRAHRIDAQGAPLGDWIPFEAVNEAYALAADPAGFVLAVSTGNEVRLIRVDRSGETRSVTLPFAEPTGALALAFDGTRYLLVRSSGFFSSAEAGMYGRLIDPATLAVSDSFVISDRTPFTLTALGRAGGALLLAGDGVFAIDDSTRTVTRAENIESAGVAASNGTTVFVSATYGSRWLRATTGEALSEPFAPVISTPEQSQPSVALGDAVDLIVWMQNDRTDGRDIIVASRIAHDGTVLDSTPRRLSTPGTIARMPVVAGDGDRFLIAWTEYAGDTGRLVARRMWEDGSIDFAPTVIANTSGAGTAIAQSGDTTLVVWTGTGTRPSTHGFGGEIFGARFDRNGLIDSVPLLISTDPWDRYYPDVAAGDGQFLVSWYREKWYGGHSPFETGAAAALVSTGGTVSPPIELHPLENAAAAGAPQVAWNGSTFLAAWRWREGTFAATITPEGTLGRAVAVPLQDVNEAAFFEGSWLLVSGLADANFFTNDRADLRSVYLSPALLVEQHLPRIGSDDLEAEPVVASNGERAIIVYRRFITEPPYVRSGTIAFRLFDAPLPAPSTRSRAVRH